MSFGQPLDLYISFEAFSFTLRQKSGQFQPNGVKRTNVHALPLYFTYIWSSVGCRFIVW